MSFALKVAAWAAATTILAPTATAYNATVSYNITVSDMSPLVRYDPSSAWNITYSDAPEYLQGMYGVGDSVHNTYGTGPSASLEFAGSSLRVNGGVDNGLSAPFDWKVDEQVMPQPNFDNGTFSPVFGRIGFGHHQFSLTLTPGTPATAHLKLTEFEIRTAIDSDATNPGEVRCNFTDFSAGTLSDDSNFNLSGSWNITQTFGGWQGQSPLRYPSIIAGNTPSISIYPPPGTSFFKLNGSVGPDYGSYSVEVDPAPPFPYKNNMFSATNAWLKPHELLYAIHLEPGVQYKITVTGDKDTGKYMGLFGAEFCYYNVDPNGAIPPGPEGVKDAAGAKTDTGSGQKAADPASSAGGNDKASSGSESAKQGSNAGAIAGGVVGGVLGAALLAILAWWLGRRQGSRTVRQHADPSMFSVEGSSVLATPYHAPAHFPPAAAGKPGFPMFAMGGVAPNQGGYQTIESQRGLYGQQLSQPSSSSLTTPTEQSRRAPSPGQTGSPLVTPTDLSSPSSLTRSPQRSPQDYIAAGGGLPAAAGPSSPIGGAGYAEYKSMLLREHGGGGDVSSSSKGDSDAKVAPDDAGAAAAGGAPGGAAYSLYKNMLLRRQEGGTPTSTLNPLLRGNGVHHAEDAGGLPSTLPPVYNPNWRPERPDGTRAATDAEMPTPGSLEHYLSGANRV